MPCRLCLCIVVVIPFILDVRFVDVPAGVSHRRKVAQDFSSTFLLRCLPSFFSREGFSRSFPSSTVKSSFVYPRVSCSPLVGQKNTACVTAPKFELTPQRQKVSRLPTEPPGRPARVMSIQKNNNNNNYDGENIFILNIIYPHAN